MVDYRVRSLKWQKAHTQPLRYRLLILLQHPCQEPKSHSFQLPSFQKKISTVVNGERCIDSIKALLNCTMNDTCLYTKTMYSQVDILYWRGSHQAENTLKKKDTQFWPYWQMQLCTRRVGQSRELLDIIQLDRVVMGFSEWWLRWHLFRDSWMCCLSTYAYSVFCLI